MMLLNEPYGNWDACKFADYFNISVRTFHRDKKMMEELGIPIYYNKNLKEYRILDNFRFKSPKLDEKETEAVLLAAKEYENRNFPMKKELESGLAKVFNSLPDYLKSSIGTYIKNYEIISDPFVKLDEHQKKFDILKKAVSSNLSVIINYYSMSSDETVERKIDTYNIFFNNGAPYLAAYCHLREDIRTFRVDRIKDIKITDNKYKIPEDYSLSEELKTVWGVEQGKKELDIKIKFTGRAARFVPEYQWSDNQEIQIKDENKIIFSVKTSSREEIKKWVLGFGSEAELLKPIELRKEIIEEIDAMLENY
jgi:predicted DNA-binding transcriptional regulator YafY